MKKRWLPVLTVFLSVLLLQTAEYLLHQDQLELRDAAQIVKGIYIWAIAPFLMVCGLYYLFLPKIKEHSRVYRLLVVIPVLMILCVSYVRMGIYLYTGERKTEAWSADGFLICTDYNGSRQTAYRPVAGIFRMPFDGWTQEAMLLKLQAQYGEGVRLVEDQGSGTFLCTAESIRPGTPPFYFTIKNDYWLGNDFLAQLMKSDASVFWESKNRAMSFYQETDACELKDYAFLELYCGGGDDILSCAADLADWYQFVREDTRYFKDQELIFTPLYIIHFYGADTVSVNFGNVSQQIKDASWNEIKNSVQEKLQEAYQRQEDINEASENTDTAFMEDEAAWEASFMEYYDGRYEKECVLEDSDIRYRMVCVDAALGSRAYALLKSSDGGASWEVRQKDPFAGQWGMGIDFTFLTEDFGFASLMHNGGDEAELYVTEDGGLSYHPSVFQGVGVTLEDGYFYNPYDYPQMPYEEDGHLYVLCGQGADGDYAGGDSAGMALFTSADHGYTFIYQKIYVPSEDAL